MIQYLLMVLIVFSVNFATATPKKNQYEISTFAGEFQLSAKDLNKPRARVSVKLVKANRVLSTEIEVPNFAFTIMPKPGVLLKDNKISGGGHLLIVGDYEFYFVAGKLGEIRQFDTNYTTDPAASHNRTWRFLPISGGHTLFIYQNSGEATEGFLISKDDSVFKIKFTGRTNYFGMDLKVAYPAVNDRKINSNKIKINGKSYSLFNIDDKGINSTWKVSAIKSNQDRISKGEATPEQLSESGQESQLTQLNTVAFVDEVTSESISLSEYLQKTFRFYKGHWDPNNHSLDEESVIKAFVALTMQTTGGALILGPSGGGKSYFMRSIIERAMSDLSLSSGLRARLYLGVTASDFASNGLVGRFENKIKALKLAASLVPLTLVIDEIQTLVGQGRAIGQPNDFFEHFKDEMATGRIRIIGATTDYEYEIFAQNRAIERRFPIKVRIESSQGSRLVKMVSAFISEHFKEWSSKISTETIEKIISIADRYNSIGVNPDKTITFVDSLLTAANILNRNVDDAFISYWAGQLYNYDVFKFSSQALNAKLSALKNLMNSKLLGLDIPKEKLYEALVYHLKFRTLIERRPFSVLMLGDSGAGKTTMANLLGEGLAMKVDRVMLSGFSHPSQATELRERIARSIRENPFKIIYLDELEKCSQSVQNAILEILDDGRFETPIGPGEPKVVDASKTIFVMAANAGRNAVNKRLSQKELYREAEADNLSRPVLDRPSLTLRFELLNMTQLEELIELRLGSLSEEVFKKSKLELDGDSLKQALIHRLLAASEGAATIGFTKNDQTGEGSMGVSARELDRAIADLTYAIANQLSALSENSVLRVSANQDGQYKFNELTCNELLTIAKMPAQPISESPNRRLARLRRK